MFAVSFGVDAFLGFQLDSVEVEILAGTVNARIYGKLIHEQQRWFFSHSKYLSPKPTSLTSKTLSLPLKNGYYPRQQKGEHSSKPGRRKLISHDSMHSLPKQLGGLLFRFGLLAFFSQLAGLMFFSWTRRGKELFLPGCRAEKSFSRQKEPSGEPEGGATTSRQRA